jgi:hypothetical protein
MNMKQKYQPIDHFGQLIYCPIQYFVIRKRVASCGAIIENELTFCMAMHLARTYPDLSPGGARSRQAAGVTLT